MASISTVFLDGTTHPDFQYTYKISGTVTEADEGKAVTLDSTAANTVKLAGADDVVIGRLFRYENRVAEGVKLATVETKGGMRLPKLASTVVAVGDSVVGEAAGLVKAAASPNWASNFVVEVGTDYVVAMFN
jgi:hypothetical protein